MSEVEAAAVGVAAVPATVPSAPAAPAPAAPVPSSPSRESLNLDAKADYLSKIAQGAAQPTVQADSEAAEVIAEATDTPVSGETETEQPPVEQTEAVVPGEEDQQPKNYQIPYDKLPENMRAELKRANLAPEVKEALAQAWYQQKALSETGFSIDQARSLKAVGFTPDAAIERIKVHPTLDDARTDAQLAGIARQIVGDYQSNPESMISGLYQNAPERFPAFAKAFASNLRSLAPEVYGETISDAVWSILQAVDNDVPADDLDMKESVARVRTKLFPNADGQKPASAFNPNDPIHKEYQRLVEQQKTVHQQQAQAFESALVQYSRDAVQQEVAAKFNEAAPGLDPDFVNRAVADVVSAVERDVMSNQNVRGGVSRFFSGSLSQEDLNTAVGYVLDRARPLMAVHMKSAMDFWSKAARPQAPPAPAVAPKPAVKPAVAAQSSSTQRVPGTTPQQTSPVTPPDSFIKDARAKGWDNFKIMQAWSAGRK